MSTIKTWEERCTMSTTAQGERVLMQTEITELREALKVAQAQIDSFCMDYRIKCDAETKALQAKLSAIEAQEPVAWGAFYFGGKNIGGLYSHCSTEESIRGYIADVHQSNDSITLRAGKLYAHPVAPAQPVKLDDIEQYRMQMAGISTAALGYWKESDTICPDYDTLALRDVAKLYAKYDELYKAAQPVNELVEALNAAATSLETIGRLAGKTHYVGDEGERVPTFMGEHSEVRGYAANRASVARTALANAKAAQPLTKESVQLKKGECWPEDVMQQWDYWRKEIANGFTGSAPRDWFESLSELRMVDFNDRQRLTKEQVEKVLQALWLGFDASLSQARVSIFNEAIEIMKGVRG
jgi:hypothetical protein